MKRPPDSSLDTPDPAAEVRAKQIRAVVYDLLSRRQQGEDVDVNQFQSDYVDLMPELAQTIAVALRTHRHVLDAQRAWGEKTDDASAMPPDTRQPPKIRGYRMRRELGSGGQGTVFEAVHEPTGRVVAVKVLTGLSKNAVARFEREAWALAHLSHPGLLAILDRGITQDGSYYLAVEHVAGTDLSEWIAARPKGEASLRDLVATFMKIAAALGAAHAQGIVHRDLKPSNVRMDALGNPRVIDFGMARLVEQDEDDRRLTMTRDVVGSVNWLSPEQATGDVQTTGPASDVYALGVMMYHSLTGNFPYAVDGPLLKALREICETPPADPCKADGRPFGKVDPILATILMKCLSKDWRTRYANGAALAADLDAYLAGKLLPAPKPSHWSWRVIASPAPVAIFAVWLLMHRYPASEAARVMILPRVTNSIGMEFIQVPSGTFRMGSPHDEPGRSDNEQSHVVEITQPFLIGQSEVTRTQYRLVTGSLPHGVPDAPGDFPVDNVSWNDAEAFCQKLHELDGRKYRLPTEAEWEYACRAGTSGAFATSSGSLAKIAWYTENSGGNLHPVAKLQPNPWGLYDMLGNVAELTTDRYVPYLGTVLQHDPVYAVGDPSFVLRGGSVADPAENCRSAKRASIQPQIQRPKVGFRVVIVLHAQPR